MIDFIETDGLNQCPFAGSSKLNINGIYDSNTANQVKVFQVWLNCYNNQEGVSGTINPTGNIDSNTWAALCTYGYNYPSSATQSISSFLKQSIAAGKNAGCIKT
jgi:hypothetical protein